MTIYFNKESAEYSTYESIIKCYRDEKSNLPRVQELKSDEDVKKAFSNINKIELFENDAAWKILNLVFDHFDSLIDQNRTDPHEIAPFKKIIIEMRFEAATKQEENFKEKCAKLRTLVRERLLNPNLTAGTARI